MRSGRTSLTKHERGGSGLGLATVHSLIRSRGGDVRINSAPGAGATISLYLPAVTESGRADDARRSARRHRRRPQLSAPRRSRKNSRSSPPASAARIPADDLGTVVQPLLAEHVEDRPGRSGLRVRRRVDDPRHPGEDDRARAHRARLERHVEGGAGQAPPAEPSRRRPQREDLGVRGRIGSQLALVGGLGERPPRRRRARAPIGTSSWSAAAAAWVRARRMKRSSSPASEATSGDMPSALRS